MAKRMRTRDTSRIGKLPDDLLLLILSLLPTLSEIARTSILSRRWRSLWHHITRLDFDASTLLPINVGRTLHVRRYVAWVNKVIHVRASIPQTPSVKLIRIWYALDATQSCHIDKWISFIVANPVEQLHLEFCPYLGLISHWNQYKLSVESWYTSPAQLSNLKCLKSLFLSCVNVSKQSIYFFLSNCPLLEDLTLDFAGCFNDLDFSGVPPLLLKQLHIFSSQDLVLTKLVAPRLTSLHYDSGIFHPKKIDVPMLTDLNIGSVHCLQPIMSFLDPFSSYLLQLERLQLVIQEAKTFRLNKMPLVALKYLKIHIFSGGFDPIFRQIINFVNDCPLLETLALEMFGRDKKNRQSSKPAKIWRKGGFCRSLKALELYGSHGKTIDQRVTKFIIKNAPHLERLLVDMRLVCRHPHLQPSLWRKKTVKYVIAKAKELCQGSCNDIGITVIG